MSAEYIPFENTKEHISRNFPITDRIYVATSGFFCINQAHT